MNALCLEAARFEPLPLFALSQRFAMDFATRDVAAADGDYDLMSAPESNLMLHQPYETLASKKPAAKPKTSRRRKGEETEERRAGAVLVVDDVPDVTEMIELLLKHAGYDVSTADSAKDALQLARKRHYDLVISDIGMPEMNGYELAAALRNLAAYNSTPLIAVTGYSEYDDRGRAVRAGFNVHLTKPIEPTQLLTLMRQLLSQTEPSSNH